jgi:hypothetical protein
MTMSNNDFIKDCVKRINEELCDKPDPNKKLLDELRKDFKPTNEHKNEHKYEVYIPNELHWVLVKLGAELQMHHEDYVELMIKKLAQQHIDASTF